MENNLVEQRFEGLIFTQSNRQKIGMNCLSNHLNVCFLSTEFQFTQKQHSRLGVKH